MRPPAHSSDDDARARGEEQARQVAAALRHGLLHDLRVRRPRHARHCRIERPAGLLLARRAGGGLRLPVHARDGRGRERVHRGGRPVRVGQARVRALAGGVAAVLYWVTNPLWVGGSLAFIATEAWRDQRLRASVTATVRRLPVQAHLHLDLDRRRDRLARARASGSRTSARSCASSCSASSRSPSSSTAIEHGVARVRRLRRCRRRARSSSPSCRCCSSTTSASSCRTAPPRRWRTRSATCRSRCSERHPRRAPLRRSRSSASCSCSRASDDHRASAASSTPSRRPSASTAAPRTRC